MISKKEFVRYIKTLREIDQSSSMLDEALKSFDSCRDFGGFSNFRSTGLIIELLQKLMNDPEDEHMMSNISYFIYDLDYGSDWTPESFIDENGLPIDISTTEKLYDYLVKNSDKTEEV